MHVTVHPELLPPPPSTWKALHCQPCTHARGVVSNPSPVTHSVCAQVGRTRAVSLGMSIHVPIRDLDWIPAFPVFHMCTVQRS